MSSSKLTNRVGPLAYGRLALALVVLAAGLVAVVPHGDARMWQASVIAGEGGHWLGTASVTLLLGWRRSWLHKVSIALTIVGIGLLFTPLMQAYRVAVVLPDALPAAFGEPPATSTTAAQPREAPLVPLDLLFGVSPGDVIADEHIYDVVDGQNLALDLYRPRSEVGPSRLLKNTRIGLFSWPSCVSRPPRQRCARGHAVPTRGPATPAAGDQGHLASRFRNRTKL